MTYKEKWQKMEDLYYQVYPDGNGFSWGSSEKWLDKAIKVLEEKLYGRRCKKKK